MTVEINVTSDVAEWSKTLTRLQKKQLPFATALAVQKTAIQARDEANKEITRKVDRPVAFTKRATIATGPNEHLDKIGGAGAIKRLKLNARATIKLKDYVGKGNPPSRYLEAIVFGKSRKHKGFEKALIRAGVMRDNEYAVPGDDLKLNSYGNIPRGAITAMLSQIKASPDPMQNATGSARSKAKRRSKAYFVMRGFRGVMVRTSKTAFTVFLAFVKRPSYRRRIQWNRRVEDTIRFRWSRNFTQSLAKALRTAR